MSMDMRPARETDAMNISRLITSLAHFYCADTSAALPAWFVESIAPEAIRERIASADYLHYVCLINGNIAGYVAIKDRRHLYHLFVAAGHQGKGIARSLWECASRLSGADYFTVRSSLYAVPVYERFGFSLSGPVGYRDGVAFQPMEYRR